MSTCTIYYPGLLGPDVPLEELQRSEWPQQNQLSHLCKLFSHGKTTELPAQHNKRSIESRILHHLGVTFDDNQDVPAAHVRSQHYELANEDLWCLDPVHLQVDLDEAILLANESLDLTEQEARHLIQDINRHFEEDDLYIHYCTPHQWVLKGNFELSTHTLSEVMHNNINEHQPAGKNESLWRKLINEVQMLLHTHPVNLAREQKGYPVVNSVWLWGGGHYNTLQTSIDQIYGDHSLIANIASVSDIPHKDLSVALNTEDFEGCTTLMIFTDQLHAIRINDVFGWFEHLKRLDGNVLGPLFDMLKQGELDKLTVHSDNIEISLTKRDLKRWWRRTRSFENNIMRLRQIYAH